MSKSEYNTISKTGKLVEGAGGKTSVATGGPNSFKGVPKGSVYAEFEVPTNSLVQGGNQNWYSVLSPNASSAMKFKLGKQGGKFINEINIEISPILNVK